MTVLLLFVLLPLVLSVPLALREATLVRFGDWKPVEQTFAAIEGPIFPSSGSYVMLIKPVDRKLAHSVLVTRRYYDFGALQARDDASYATTLASPEFPFPSYTSRITYYDFGANASTVITLGLKNLTCTKAAMNAFQPTPDFAFRDNYIGDVVIDGELASGFIGTSPNRWGPPSLSNKEEYTLFVSRNKTVPIFIWTPDWEIKFIEYEARDVNNKLPSNIFIPPIDC